MSSRLRAILVGSAVGPMARSVEDLRASVCSACRGASAAREGLRRQRAAWYADDGVAPVTGETQVAVKKLRRNALADAGLVIEETRPPGIERSHELWLKIFSRASVVQLRNFYRGHEVKGRLVCSLAIEYCRQHAGADSR